MARKPRFAPIDSKVSFVALEKKWLSRWYESGLVEKYLNKNKSSKKTFSFLDGPITANNPMGVHHAWGRTYKDIWQRYKNMRGFRQRFQNGFDAQGLWVEVEVEKELGFKNKKDIEKYGIARFVQKCKDRVMKYSTIQTEQSKRLGYFMDWENSYFTLSDDNNYMIWHFLKKCHERGLIYKGRDSVPWCPRCGTAISQHEMLTEDYKEATHDSVYVEYPIKGRKNEYLLVWTTTPWTLPANVALAVSADEDYAVAIGDVAGNKYYVGKKSAERLGLKIEKTIKGKELVELKYESPFDNLPRVQKQMGEFEHQVVAADKMILEINQDEGTGLVHIAPGAGTEDFRLGKKLDLPVIDVIDEEANYLSGMEHFSGVNAKDNPDIILEFLKERDNGEYLFDIVSVTHRYPSCWRCRAELVWRVVDEWYIAMDPVRGKMKKVAKKISWIPGFGLKRELDWLENMDDWLISKKRYWGLALPIWECQECANFEVIGSKEELKERAVEGWEEFEGHSPHRPWVDNVAIKCEKCGGTAARIPDVGNPWLDAGIVPYSTIKENNKGEPLYAKDKKLWRQWFPADFITESFPGQFKNWFYSLIAQSTILENEEPFRTVLGHATLLGEDGRPMHKSWGNSIEFNEGADKIGVDVMRFLYAKQDPTQNLLFGYRLADQTRRSFHLMLWNVYNFFVTYANIDEWRPSGEIESENILDVWITARLSQTIRKTTNSLDKYDARSAAESIEAFVQDLSLWYVRRSRDRKESCYAVLYSVLVSLSQLLAPFTPFLAEEMYQNLTSTSVHLSDWPTAPKLTTSEKKLIEQMSVIRKVVERGHAVRKEEDIPVRQPLGGMTVSSAEKRPDESLLQLVKEELNIKSVEWKTKSELREPEVKLDTKITPSLREEGKARELARQVQEERKKLGTPLDAQVEVISPWLPKDEKLFEWLKQRTLAKSLKEGESFSVKEA